MYRFLFIIACSLVFPGYLNAQSEYSGEYVHGFAKNRDQNYLGARYEGFSDRNSWGIGLYYSFGSFRKDNEKQHACGWGLYADYRYALDFGLTGNPFAGLRTAFSFEKNRKGEKYTLWSPSLQFGYHYTAQDFNEGGAFTPYAALGYDKILGDHASTNSTYQGFVFLAGFTAGYRF
jgi:hypothetical protein